MSTIHFVLLFLGISQSFCAIVEELDSSEVLNSHVVPYPSNKLQCEFYNATCFSEGLDPKSCQGVRTCADQNHFCYVVWRHEDSNSTRHKSGRNVQLMGCFEPSEGCSLEDECLEEVEDDPKPSKHFFCCCRGHLCNSKFEWVHVPKAQQPLVPTNTPPASKTISETFIIAIGFLILCVIIISFLLWWVFKKRKESNFEALPTAEMEGGLNLGLGSGQFDLQLPQNIDLYEEIGKGKSGTVRKGKLNDKIVAIKIFMPQCKQSWTLEKEIYSLPQMMEKDSILKFLGVSERRDNLGQFECWLGTEYHPKGSLYDFLKANLVSWDDLCKIALSIGKGLAFLHEEIPANGKQEFKPVVAHRDFKSKNVLIKDDLTACISDFGLALKIEPGLNSNTQVAQVGTTRYMAPEVLQCAISFEKNALPRADMYACGLVLWELASRCTLNHAPTFDPNIINPEPVTEEYKLPYEAEISKNPSIEEMNKLVVEDRVRPQMKTGNREWRSNPGARSGANNMNMLCDTIEELWERDEGARISAACLVERVKSFQHQSFVMDMSERLNALNNDSGVGSTASSNNGTSSSTDLEGQDLDSRAQSIELTEREPLVNLNQNP